VDETLGRDETLMVGEILVAKEAEAVVAESAKVGWGFEQSSGLVEDVPAL